MSAIDITPSPRVLRMLGQIDFQPWQCLAELIDNSIDAFLDGRNGRKTQTLNPTIEIFLPSSADLEAGGGQLVLRDNGPGMTEHELANAVKAGYSGNDPVEKLGLFGMGFNIATARMGRRTVVRTTTSDSDRWIKLVIDFDALERTKTFSAPRTEELKTPDELERGVRGTEISIQNLESERFRPLVYGKGRAATRVKLGKIYGRVMQELGITIKYDGLSVSPRRHCVWDSKRAVKTESFGSVPAVIEINEDLGEARFCTACWVWLPEGEATCPSCGTHDHCVSRRRRITGWLGIQRYFHQEHYGLDLIRNGRVIEELDKSLFYWQDPESLETELEYPIDATHWGGRIVGELEIDFVRVSHQKDAFDKLDPEWRKVVEKIRGGSPLRPQIAKRLGLPHNTSHLARLFAGYRGGYAGLRALVPGNSSGQGNNGREISQEWVERYHSGDPEYLSDEKWYELVLLAEKGQKGGSKRSKKDAGELPMGLGSPSGQGDQAPQQIPTPPVPQVTPVDEADKDLSRVYVVSRLPGEPTMRVSALRSSGLADAPVRFEASGSNVTFRYNPEHAFFEASLVTPRDCLIADLAHRFLLMSGAAQQQWPVSLIEQEIRKAYFPESLTVLDDAVKQAGDELRQLREHLEPVALSAAPSARTLPPEVLRTVTKRILEEELGDAGAVRQSVESGAFVRYVDNAFLPELIRWWPGEVLDGRFVAVPYKDVQAELRENSIEMVFDGYRDLLWLVSEAGGNALNRNEPWRLRYARALASLRLLKSWRV